MTTQKYKYHLPALQSFSKTKTYMLGGHTLPALELGRGEAGWTVYGFETKEQMLDFMKEHSYAAMPCWKRVEQDPEVAIARQNAYY